MTAKTFWHAAFVDVWWVHGPVPIGQSHFVGYGHSLIASFAYWILFGNIDSPGMEYLLKKSEIRPMPGAKHIAYVGTVTHHLLALYSLDSIPCAKRNTVNAYNGQRQLLKEQE